VSVAYFLSMLAVMWVVWVERRGRCSLREVDRQGRGLRFRSELFSRTEKVHVLASGTLGTCSFDLDLLDFRSLFIPRGRHQNFNCVK
jgi:hypothetical protein